MSGDIDAGRVERLAEIAEWDGRDDRLVVVAIESRPAAIAALHAEGPGKAALDRRLDAAVEIARFAAQLGEDQQGEGGIVHVGIAQIGALERPAARRDSLDRQRPIARLENLIVENID